MHTAAAKVYSENSWKTHHSKWRKYLDFCVATQCVALPCSAIILCAYIAFLAHTLKYTSICQDVSALRTLHLLNDMNVNAFDCLVVKATLKSYKRILGVNILHQHSVAVSMLRQIVDCCDIECESGLIAILLIGFFTFMRKSSLLLASENCSWFSLRWNAVPRVNRIYWWGSHAEADPDQDYPIPETCALCHFPGAPLELIQAQGDWCSMAVLVYLTMPCLSLCDKEQFNNLFNQQFGSVLQYHNTVSVLCNPDWTYPVFFRTMYKHSPKRMMTCSPPALQKQF